MWQCSVAAPGSWSPAPGLQSPAGTIACDYAEIAEHSLPSAVSQCHVLPRPSAGPVSCSRCSGGLP